MPIQNNKALSNLTEEPKKGRVKKADKPFAPEGSRISESSLGLAERIYEHVHAYKAAQRNGVQRNVWASGIKDCARQTAFSIMGFQRAAVGQDHPEWKTVAEFGTVLHDTIEEWLSAIGVVVKKEFRVASACGSLTGKVDAHIRIDNVDYILDVKTVGRKDFDAGAHGRKFPGYNAQLSAYGHILGIEKGIILLACRDSGRLQEYIIDLDPEYGREQIIRAESIMRAAEQRVLPPAEEKILNRGIGCMFCPFKRQCDEQEINGSTQALLDLGTDPKEI